MSDTVEGAKPRQSIVRLAPAPPYNGIPGVKVMLACGHVFLMHGIELEVKDGTLECGRCLLSRNCAWCEEAILGNEPMAELEGGVYHQECEVREFQGPAAHFMKECPCFGGTRSDPPGMSKRDSARLAFEARKHALEAGEEKLGGDIADNITAALTKVFGEGRVLDLGTFRMRGDGTLERSDDDEDDDDDDE